MRTKRQGAATLLALIIGCGLMTAADAADAPNVIVIGEDASRDTVPRSSRLFAIAARALHERLGDAGFAVKAAVPRSELPSLVPALKACGGTDIVVSSVSQIVP